MSDKRDDSEPKAPAAVEVRYSEKFLHERRRKEQRTRLFGGLMMLAVALAILKESLDAHRAHTWVNLAARINQQILFPPILGGLFGLLILCISLYLFWEYFFRRK